MKMIRILTLDLYWRLSMRLIRRDFLEKKASNLKITKVKEKGSLAKLTSWLREKRQEVKGNK